VFQRFLKALRNSANALGQTDASRPASLALKLRSTFCAYIDDGPGLERMEAAWVSNVGQFRTCLGRRGGTVDGPRRAPGLPPDALALLEQQIGRSLPSQLRWAFSRSSEWTFGWSYSPVESLPRDLAFCYSGGIRGAIWTANGLAELPGRMASWVAHHVDSDGHVPEEAIARYREFWSSHVPFMELSNGDLLTLDTRNDDPAFQPVRYFSHEQDRLHGDVLAGNLFGFIGAWTSLGCVGDGASQWLPLLRGTGEMRWEFDVEGPVATQWISWLQTLPGRAQPGERPPRVAARTESDYALLFGARDNDLCAVVTALAQGASTDCEDLNDRLFPGSYSGAGKDMTAARMAAQHNNLEMLEALVAHGASLSTHELPLSHLIFSAGEPRTANPATLLWLIEHGARIDPWLGTHGSALHQLYDNPRFREEDYWRLLRAMIAQGCDVDVGWGYLTSELTTTLLMRAKHRTQEVLLEAGADVTRRTLDGQTAMHRARTAESVSLLKAHGLDVNDLSRPPRRSDAVRPLHTIRTSPEEAPRVLERLLAEGADPRLLDGEGLDAWWHCPGADAAAVLEKVIALDARVRDAQGRTLLHRHLHDHRRLVDIALFDFWCSRGLDVNAHDARGNTALHLLAGWLAHANDIPGVTALREAGARTDLRNRDGKRPGDLLDAEARGTWGALFE